MFEDTIDSDDSEGLFNDFIEEQFDNLIDNVLQDGNLENIAGNGSDVVFEMDQIEVPRFVHDDSKGGQGGGKGKGEPGKDGEKIRFSMPFSKFMELAGKKLGLPNLRKTGQGKIKEVVDEFKSFGPCGVLLDRRRTFKRAFKSSVGSGIYRPDEGVYEIQISRKDKRFKLPETVEKPKYKAVCFYMGDISYSTHGERLKIEKQLVKFIQNWLDYNYGQRNVEHRFFVHDAKAYEVLAEDFYNVSNAGGTYASMVFDLVSQVALSEYDPQSVNFYGFYFGDGEIFGEDGDDIVKIIEENMRPYFNRIGIVEVLPSSFSRLLNQTQKKFSRDPIVRPIGLGNKKQILGTIKKLFEEVHANHW